ncbi:YncE family protein [Halonatronum saccharophilum]|uniref:YncE family protein n=1 Tax=Halonatronum saccharophilum TaxID=150060 RepID=UPI000482580C|nr:hypothetical protein [Halonatronum saccharophilum]
MVRKFRKSLLLVLLLAMGVLVVGCSEDSFVRRAFRGESNRTSFIEGVTGPRQVIVDQESRDFEVDAVKINEEVGEEISYQWILGDSNLAEFTSPNEAQTKVIGRNPGITTVKVIVDGVQSGEIPFEVLREYNENYYTYYETIKDINDELESGFHAIVPAQDSTRRGYIAVGYTDRNNNQVYPYIVKANRQGMTIWDKKVGDEGEHGRFYGIQDVVYPFGGNDWYYLIGYQRETSKNYRPYIAKMNNVGEIKHHYLNMAPSNDAYLRDGIAIQSSEVANQADQMVAVGNIGISSQSKMDPYIVVVDIVNENEGSVDGENMNTIIVKDDALLTEKYYNLESIVRTKDGFLAAGLVGNSRDNSNGILMRFNDTFELQEVYGSYGGSSSLPRLWKLKGEDNHGFIGEEDEFVVVGDNGYVARVDLSSGKIEIKDSTNISDVSIFRDLLNVDDGYILVGTDGSNGVVYKVDNNLRNAKHLGDYGTYIHSIAESTDGDYYYLAGTGRRDGRIRGYVVKIDNNGDIVKRNL